MHGYLGVATSSASANQQQFAGSRNRADVLESIFSDGFQYSRRLNAHTSCINALTFSNGEGQFLASGGDDLKICLWDFYQEDVNEPIGSLVGPRGNILKLTFSASNQYLFSGGIDNTIFQYDVSYLGSSRAQLSSRSPDGTCSWHSDSVRDISCRPNQDEVYLSGSEDGSIIRHDLRDSHPSRAQNTLQLKSEVTGVQYHPHMEYIFLTSDQSGAVCLRDERMAFGPLSRRSREGIVQVYNTKLTRPGIAHLSNPEVSSIAFDRDGTRFAVTMLDWYPTIYSVSDLNPIVSCTGQNHPDGSPVPSGQRSYRNRCTMKHGSFGGPGLDSDEFYAAGSDDFRGYVWRLPPTSELVSQRREFSPTDWQTQDNQGSEITGFTSAVREKMYIPVALSTPLCRLTGHNSIVNTAVFHPHFLHILTSGVERRVVLHSPTPSSPCTQNLVPSPTEVRELDSDGTLDRITYNHALLGAFTTVGETESELSDDWPERRTISMFDHILREEGSPDVFAVRRWVDSDHSSSDEVSDSGSDDDDMEI
ncbi:DDB1- and CUL4-associated factor 5 [Leucoagaricus sp. SymC.cos]|nr:DDB1- and CUL4-associated factor 5 [Leucoagaricus sp. SymC.cos]